MALILSVEKGHGIEIGASNPVTVLVDEIMSSQRFKLRVVGASMDAVFEVSNRFSTEIVPQVRVSAGRGTNQIAKLIVEAPRNIHIMRKDLLDEVG